MRSSTVLGAVAEDTGILTWGQGRRIPRELGASRQCGGWAGTCGPGSRWNPLCRVAFPATVSHGSGWGRSPTGPLAHSLALPVYTRLGPHRLLSLMGRGGVLSAPRARVISYVKGPSHHCAYTR